MNFTLYIHTFRQILHQRLRLVLTALVFLGSLLFYKIPGAFEKGYLTAPWFVWLLGNGLVGKDVSQGALHLYFTRPIHRASYLLTKWAALVTVATGLAWIHLLLGVSISGSSFDPAALATVGLAAFLLAAGMAALAAALSCWLSGMGDLPGYIGLIVSSLILKALLEHWNIPTESFQKAAEEFLFPGVSLAQTVASGTWGIGPWLPYLAVVLACLALGIWGLDRKELGYSQNA